MRVVGVCGLLTIGALAWLGLGLTPGDRAPAPAARPNVLIVMWDTVRADRLGCYGQSPSPTPHLDAFAAGARVYEQAVSPAIWTIPSHASILTGLVPSEHGATAYHKWLDGRFTTLAETLRDAGYDTYCFSSNPHFSRNANLVQGFSRDEYAWDERWKQRVAEIIARKVAPQDASNEMSVRINESRRQQGKALIGEADLKEAGPVIREALEGWLASREDDRPWFAFLNYMEAHDPRIPSTGARQRVMPPEQVRQSYLVDQSHDAQMEFMFGRRRYSAEDLAVINGVYNASLVDLDAATHALLEMLAQRGLLDKTVVIVVSDHGENLGEHGLMEHKYSIYNTLTRVPLLLRYPPRVEPGRVREPTPVLDVYATVLDLAGVAPPAPTPNSVSLLAAERDARRPIVSEMLAPTPNALLKASQRFPDLNWTRWMRTYRAIELDGYKLIVASEGGNELYNVRTDPGETENLIAQEAEQARQLEAALRQWFAGLTLYDEELGQSERAAPISPEQLERLRTLGYLGGDKSEDGNR